MSELWQGIMVGLATLFGAPVHGELAAMTIAVALVAVGLVLALVCQASGVPGAEARTIFARHGAGRAPTPAQSDPDAPGRPRPRAPGIAAAAA